MKNYLLKNLTAAFVIVFTVGVGGACAETLEDKLNLLPPKERNWINDSCPKLLGPKLWTNCVEKELDVVIKGIPKIEGFSKEDKEWLTKSCSEILGPNLYKSCLIKEISALKSGIPKLDDISESNKNWVLESCPKVLGPNLYKSCVVKELSAIKRSSADGKEIANLENKKNIERERQQLVEERRKFEEEKRSREQARNNQRLSLQVTNTQANAEGDFVINIHTGTDTASLKINGEEQGGKQDGIYSIKRVARAGQTTQFTILAKDVYGNSDSKTISVARQVAASSQVKYAELNPALVKTQPNKDAVAIIIGIADYKNLPRADYANDDARAFYDYAMRGLGVRAENIKLLVDGDAGQGEILKTFKTWLPSRVKSTTDVYVYYSGHGLPSADGQTLYLLPQQADRDLIEDTAVAQSRINAAIQAAKPKSVTIFLDSCYSGAARTGQTLLASARPISLKANTQTFPSDFTVFTASTAEQISSSSNELKHGIFSYYLMRGMEGDADANKDGKITAGEMQAYLTENVAKQASIANRVQQPQLTGDANRVLVGK